MIRTWREQYARMAQQLLHGDETTIVDRRIVGDGAPLRIASGTGVTGGKMLRGGASAAA